MGETNFGLVERVESTVFQERVKGLNKGVMGDKVVTESGSGSQ